MDGTVINDSYKVAGPLDLGGSQANVWDAVDLGSSERVALKIYRKQTIEAGVRDRFEREIEALQAVNSPYVVEFRDSGVCRLGPREYFYVVMEQIDGEPLSDIFEREGRLDEQRVLRMAGEIARGLKEIHQHAILHRDLKPSNVMIDRNGSARIIDFGFAKLLDRSSISSEDLVGALRYVSPESLETSEVDQRSDLYSLGVILFEALAGQPIYSDHEFFPLMQAIRTQRPPLLRDVTADVSRRAEQLIDGLLKREPHHRPTTAREFITLLDQPEPLTTGQPLARQLAVAPQFIASVLKADQAILAHYAPTGSMSSVMTQANMISENSAIKNVCQENDVSLFIDPLTYRLTHSGFTATQSLQALPYVYDKFQPKRLADFVSQKDIDRYAKDVIDYQISCGATALLPPFHYAIDSEDAWMELDMRLFEAGYEYVQSLSDAPPLYAAACTNVEILCDESERRTLMRRLTRIRASGYWLFMTPFDGISNNRAQMLSYLQFVHDLRSNGQPVLVGRMNALGFAFLAAGADGFSGGLGISESFDIERYRRREIRRRPSERIYVSELMLSIPKEKLTQITDHALKQQLSCRCGACAGTALSETARSKGHFLLTRQQELREFAVCPPEERGRLFRERALRAQALRRSLARAGVRIGIVGDAIYAWLATFDEAASRGIVAA